MLGPRLNNSWRVRILAIVVFLVLCTFFFPSSSRDEASYRGSELSKYRKNSHKSVQAAHLTQHPFREPIENFEKPLDFRIVALVFFGRREYVQILDCYLKVSSVNAPSLVLQRLTTF